MVYIFANIEIYIEKKAKATLREFIIDTREQPLYLSRDYSASAKNDQQEILPLRESKAKERGNKKGLRHAFYLWIKLILRNLRYYEKTIYEY